MWLVYIVLFLLLLLYMKSKNNKDYDGFNKLPGPPTLPVIGNLLDIGSNGIECLENLENLRKKYGSIYKLWIGPLIPTIVLTDPIYLETLLSSTLHVKKSNSYHIFHSWLGDGLIPSNGGEKWRKHRKLLTPAFHFKILESFIPTFELVADRLLGKLESHSNENSFNVFKLINLYTLDVFNHTSMGVDLHIQDNPDHDYVTTLEHYEDLFTKRQFSLLGRYEHLYKYLPVYGTFVGYVNTLKKFTEDLIKDRKRERRATKVDEYGIKNKRAFVDLMLDSELTDDEIREELDNFMFAGHDTTAAGISFALYALSINKNVQDKVHDEILSVTGLGNAKFTLNDVQDMNYLECVVKEVLRKYPPVPLTEREIDHDLHFGDTFVPRGTIVSVFIYGTHHNEKYFPDPDKFDPDRFLPENTSERHPFAFTPFNAGPRNCIGQKFAMLEMKLTIAKIIKNFEILPAVPDHKLILAATVILKSANGVYIRLKKRNR